MKCLIGKVLDDQVVLITRDGEFRTVALDFVRGNLPHPESDVTVEVLRSWTGRELEMPWPPPAADTGVAADTVGEAEMARVGRAAGEVAHRRDRRGWKGWFGNTGWLSGLGVTAVAAAVFGFAFLPRALTALTALTAQQVQAVVAIDINPSLELQVDAAGRVLHGIPLNEDARRLLQAQPVQGLPIDQAMNRVVDQAVAFGYLAPGKDNVILASVIPLKEGNAPNPATLQQEAAARLKAARLSGYVAVRQVAAEVRTRSQKDAISVNRELAREVLSQRGVALPLEALRGQSIAKALRDAGVDIKEAFPGGTRSDDEADEKQVESGASGSGAGQDGTLGSPARDGRRGSGDEAKKRSRDGSGDRQDESAVTEGAGDEKTAGGKTAGDKTSGDEEKKPSEQESSSESEGSSSLNQRSEAEAQGAQEAPEGQTAARPDGSKDDRETAETSGD